MLHSFGSDYLFRPSLSRYEFATHTETVHHEPLRLLAFHTLKGAFADALNPDRQIACDAIKFIRGRTNWTLIPLEKRMERWHAPAPPIEVRREGYPLSFDFCCELLDWPPDEIRRRGLTVRKSSTKAFGWGRHGGLSNWRVWRQRRRERAARAQAHAQAHAQATIVTTSDELVSVIL